MLLNIAVILSLSHSLSLDEIKTSVLCLINEMYSSMIRDEIYRKKKRLFDFENVFLFVDPWRWDHFNSTGSLSQGEADENPIFSLPTQMKFDLSPRRSLIESMKMNLSFGEYWHKSITFVPLALVRLDIISWEPTATDEYLIRCKNIDASREMAKLCFVFVALFVLTTFAQSAKVVPATVLFVHRPIANRPARQRRTNVPVTRSVASVSHNRAVSIASCRKIIKPNRGNAHQELQMSKILIGASVMGTSVMLTMIVKEIRNAVPIRAVLQSVCHLNDFNK